MHKAEIGRRALLAASTAIAAASLLPRSGVAQRDGAAVPTRISLVHAGAVSASVAVPRAIAEEQRLFAKHGLDVLLVRDPNGATIGTKAEFGYLGSGGILLAIVQYGLDLKIIGAFSTGRTTSQLIARADIKKPEDLRGKRFGVITLGAGVWVTTMQALEHFGLEPIRDNIAILPIGNVAEIAKALEEGRIDAAMLTPAQSRQMRSKGFAMLLDMSANDIHGPQGLLAASPTYLQQHPDVAKNLVTALVEAGAFSLAPGNKETVLRTLMSEYHLNDPAAAERGYQDLRNINRKPYAAADRLRNLQKVMAYHEPKVLGLQVEALIDNRFVRALDEGGAIDALYASYGVR